MALDLLLLTAGFVLLCYGADWLVKGASELARSLGIAPIVIGLTVVAFGTSAPELVVSVFASLAGNGPLAVSNVFGSNICNIALVLGMAAALRPIQCDRVVVTRDIPIMLLLSVVTMTLLANGVLGQVEGAFLVAGILIYSWMNYRTARRGRIERMARLVEEIEKAPVGPRETVLLAASCALPAAVAFARGDLKTGVIATGMLVTAAAAHDLQAFRRSGSRLVLVALVIAGSFGVGLGGHVVVEAAKGIMSELGVDQTFVGLTIVAFGTSLPELATSIVAALKKEMDLSVGNLVGSNVFNLLSVLGAASLVRPIVLSADFVGSPLFVAGLVMLFTSALPWFMMRKASTVSRLDGLVLLGCYVGFFAYLVVTS